MLDNALRGVAVGVLAAALLAASPAAADRSTGQHSEPSPSVQRNGCVTWAEFNMVPTEDGGRLWSRAEIEKVWQASGILDRTLTDDDLAYYDYQRCGRVGYGVNVIYWKRPGRPWVWVAKGFPCPCPGARQASVVDTARSSRANR